MKDPNPEAARLSPRHRWRRLRQNSPDVHSAEGRRPDGRARCNRHRGRAKHRQPSRSATLDPLRPNDGAAPHRRFGWPRTALPASRVQMVPKSTLPAEEWPEKVRARHSAQVIFSHQDKISSAFGPSDRRLAAPHPEMGIDLDLTEAEMAELMRKCEVCGHSKAAHVDGVRCSLCRCRSERTELVQDSFAFRSALTLRSIGGRRKR